VYRHLPRGLAIRQAVALVQAVLGDAATRERMQTIITTTRVGARAPSLAALFARRVAEWSGAAAPS
jgi:hypothetical protein